MAEIIVFVVVRYICILRSYLLIRASPTLRKRLSDDSNMAIKGGEIVEVQALDEWEEVERPSDSSVASASAMNVAV